MHLGDTVTECVISVPAYFDEGQRQATKDAATIAGMEVIVIFFFDTIFDPILKLQKMV